MTNPYVQRIAAFLAPIALALLLAPLSTQPPPVDEALIELPLEMRTVEVSSAAELEALFDSLDYHWPLQRGDRVPALSVVRIPPDLAELRDIRLKKSLFFRALLPLVIAENEAILKTRGKVLALLARPPQGWSEEERQWLASIARLYRTYGDLSDPKVQRKLLRRIDIVPPALALAQAANESAWGTSRFAQLANNLFGQWTYKESEGIVPLDRPAGAKYAVRRFDTLDASVRAYLLNLNTNPAYRDLRLLREQMRREGRPLDAAELAAGLHHYSARGADYIEEIRAMIRVNRLTTELQELALRSGHPEAPAPAEPEAATPTPERVSLAQQLFRLLLSAAEVRTSTTDG